jgi:hypothetical protein
MLMLQQGSFFGKKVDCELRLHLALASDQGILLYHIDGLATTSIFRISSIYWIDIRLAYLAKVMTLCYVPGLFCTT